MISDHQNRMSYRQQSSLVSTPRHQPPVLSSQVCPFGAYRCPSCLHQPHPHPHPHLHHQSQGPHQPRQPRHKHHPLQTRQPGVRQHRLSHKHLNRPNLRPLLRPLPQLLGQLNVLPGGRSGDEAGSRALLHESIQWNAQSHPIYIYGFDWCLVLRSLDAA